ncbi:RHS repeat-associated core domain-containing protein [Planctomicrobium piriforme]|uniref:RHS repeat-associated core domain-containing protein n=1 Tax=Planctomicrobium piriforme TaxID=1576369 RepID=A0A1I3Q1N4_9PLAN|nr:RHS repeat-associated core domain-containing protein [Planctomicrobium piriforme]SFJ28094.1 RHS repeat-associated core domain-containing protein [Planctomicrobium piriforme]
MTDSVIATTTFGWTYDSLGRLTQETLTTDDSALTDCTTTYEFDLTGNRLTKSTVGGETVISTYDANDRLLTETSSTGTTTSYGFDHTQQTYKEIANGSVVTSKVYNTFDLQGRLATVTTETYTSGTLSTRQRVTMGYNENGVRTSSKVEVDENTDGTYEQTTTTTFLNDFRNRTGYSQVLHEIMTDINGTVTKRVEYTFGHDLIAQTVYNQSNPSGLTAVFHTDGHGSTRVLMDLTAMILQQYAYDAYGNLLNMQASAAITSYLYSGEQFDASIGQQYLRSRWYDPSTGRFTTLDPFFGQLNDPQSLHKYLYVHGDPITGIDPNGREFTVAGLVSGISIGAISGAIAGAAIEGTRAAIKQQSFQAIAYSTVTGALSGAFIGGLVGGSVYGLAAGMSYLAPGLAMSEAIGGAYIIVSAPLRGASMYETVDAAKRGDTTDFGIGLASTILGYLPIVSNASPFALVQRFLPYSVRRSISWVGVQLNKNGRSVEFDEISLGGLIENKEGKGFLNMASIDAWVQKQIIRAPFITA